MPRKKLGAKASDDEGDNVETGTAKKEEKKDDMPRSVYFHRAQP